MKKPKRIILGNGVLGRYSFGKQCYAVCILGMDGVVKPLKYKKGLGKKGRLVFEVMGK
jgi:hypothetical protein